MSSEKSDIETNKIKSAREWLNKNISDWVKTIESKDDFDAEIKWKEVIEIQQLTSHYEQKLSYQNEKQVEILNKINETITLITPYIKYCRINEYQKCLNNLNSLKNNLPILLMDVNPIKLPEGQRNSRDVVGYDFWNRKYRRRRTSNNWDLKLVTHIFNENPGFDVSIKTYKTKCDDAWSAIKNECVNNCDNPNTLLDEDGLQTCKVNDLIKAFKTNIESYKTQSNRVMQKIQNTPDFPQYAQAKQIDDRINDMYDWNPLAERCNINSAYAKDTYGQIKGKLVEYEKTIMSLYNDCDDINTHIGINENDIPTCVRDDYNNSKNKCSQAIEMSKKYEYSEDKLAGLWKNVSDSIPGNSKGVSETILLNTNNSCKKWVDMFDIWEEEEAKALSEPCIPERTIINANDPVILKVADDWNIAASDHIKQLKQRLIKIQNYIKNYPNILHVEKTGITTAPSSMIGTSNIKVKTDNSIEGGSPNFYLEMIVPNGEPGKKGDTGEKGGSGYKGNSNKGNNIGKTGKNVTSRYNKN